MLQSRIKVRDLVVGAAVTMTVLPATTLSAQGASYDVPGIVAWSTAKTYGFEFHPVANSGESLARPLDGMNTLLKRTTKTLLTTKTYTIAQVVGGQPSVNPGERNTTFQFFGGRTLQPGWTVKSVDMGGNFTFVDQPRLATSDLSFRVRLAPGGSATLRKVVLNGPAGSDWKDAFSAPLRKDYVINGVVAWNAAQRYGFTFTPAPTRSDFPATVMGRLDGVFTALTVQVDRRLFGTRCTVHPNASSHCIMGQIVGGNMSVSVPFQPEQPSMSVVFEMFGGKKLSSGWIVKSVTTSNGVWKRQPAYGSDDLSFVITLTSYGDVAATSIVKSITLEGPSNAASFEDAFKGAH
jgi:hypothetical protein